MSYVDVSVAPWFLRISRVLHHYRGWPLPDKNSRLGKWIDALETSEAVKNTTSDDVLYIDSYERYAGKISKRSVHIYDHSVYRKHILCCYLYNRPAILISFVFCRKPARHESGCEGSECRAWTSLIRKHPPRRLCPKMELESRLFIFAFVDERGRGRRKKNSDDIYYVFIMIMMMTTATDVQSRSSCSA
jgi:hypothetical protein